MRRPFGGPRKRRPLFVLGIALNAVLMSLLMSGLGAAPVAAATPAGQVWNTTTQTSWIPLQCNLNGTLTTGIPVHIGVAIRATFPATLTPGQKFSLTNVTAYQIQPGAAQFAANSFNADQVAGTVTDFSNKLTGVTGGFNAPDTGTQVNQVRALQPSNIDTPNPVDPLVNPTTASPAPGQWWADQSPAVAASDPIRHNLFSFGGIPINTNGGPGVPTAYGPTPGTGGGSNPNLALDGVADPINIYPFVVSGAAGTNAVVDVGDASRMVTTLDGSGPFVAFSNVFFHSVATGKWEQNGTTTNGFPTYCGTDATSFAVPSPDPTYVTKFTIPIVAAQGQLRVTGSPALPSQISIDGNIGDSWGETWVELPAGAHNVCFTHIEGYTEPACSSQTLSNGVTTTVAGTFTQRGSLRVLTSPAVNSQVKVDGIPRNNWGMWTDVPTGAHQVCFGAVANFTPPACQNATVTAGTTTTITGTYTSTSGAPGQTGVGLLRVTTNPAVPSQITVDGNIADSWGLTWLEIAPGAHTVCFSHIEGYTEPACSSQTITSGATTTLVGNFTQRGSLRVLTSPAVASTVYLDDIPRNDWGMWTDVPVGSHVVCFGPAPGGANLSNPPACQTAVVTAGGLTTITGTYH
jgi:hypothetical protein